MNEFDAALLGETDESLSGITSSIKKLGRQIDYARRKITPKPLRKIQSSIGKELVRFLASDLGKIVAVVVVVVATVYGLGPVVLKGIKVAIKVAGAYVKLAAKAAAKYIVKNASASGLKKMAAKKLKNELIKRVAQKGGKEYAKHQMRKMERANQLSAEETKAYEDQVFREMEAQFLKDSGQTMDSVQSAQQGLKKTTKQVIPKGFKYDTPKPRNPAQFGTGRDRWAMEAWGRSLSKWKSGHDRALNAYIAKHPAQPDSVMNQMFEGIDSMAANMRSVEESPKYQEVKATMQSRGVPAREIKKTWLASTTFRQVTTASTVKAFAPMMAQSYINQGASVSEAREQAIVATAKMGENAVAIRQSMAPLAILGAVAAAAITLI